MIINIVDHAQYVVMLANNTVTDEAREKFFATKEDRRGYGEALNLIVTSIVDGLKKGTYSVETAKTLLANEYGKSNLAEYFGDYSHISALVDIIIANAMDKKRNHTLDDLKEVIAVVDKLDADIAVSAYYVILNIMCLSEKVVEDLEFSQKLISFIKGHSDIDEHSRFLFTVINDAFLRN